MVSQIKKNKTGAGNGITQRTAPLVLLAQYSIPGTV